jgi:vancomycin resistance protein YoaR
LVQTIVDPASARLQVDIYGTRDGRRVEMTEPVVSNIRPAPEPLYQDDPTLPKGTTKQVDFAAAGATSVFTRKVYKGDKLIIDDTIKSNFRPWQAVFLVGTGG